MYKQIDYGVDTGVSVTRKEQIAYNTWFAETVSPGKFALSLDRGGFVFRWLPTADRVHPCIYYQRCSQYGHLIYMEAAAKTLRWWVGICTCRLV